MSKKCENVELKCEKCGIIPFVQVDGYMFYDRLLEGIKIKIYCENGKWKAGLVNKKDEDYTATFNMKQVFKDAVDFATEEDGLDVAQCPICKGPVVPPNYYIYEENNCGENNNQNEEENYEKYEKMNIFDVMEEMNKRKKEIENRKKENTTIVNKTTIDHKKPKIINITSIKQIIEKLEADGDLRKKEIQENYKIYEDDDLGFYQQACEYLIKKIENKV